MKHTTPLDRASTSHRKGTLAVGARPVEQQTKGA